MAQRGSVLTPYHCGWQTLMIGARIVALYHRGSYPGVSGVDAYSLAC